MSPLFFVLVVVATASLWGGGYAFGSRKGRTARAALADEWEARGTRIELLESEDVLLVPGSSFNVPYRTHFRLTLLPQAELVDDVFARIERALERASRAAHLQQAVA